MVPFGLRSQYTLLSAPGPLDDVRVPHYDFSLKAPAIDPEITRQICAAGCAPLEAVAAPAAAQARPAGWALLTTGLLIAMVTRRRPVAR